jgi:ribosomal protein S18 acetylase RimI-like enzyme
VFITDPIEDGDPNSGFCCGEPALDAFFARHALGNHRRGLGRTFVLRRGDDLPATLPALLGFYTLSMADLEAARVPQGLRAGLPRYPVPVALIGRLGVDSRVQGLRLGERLLTDALARVVLASQQIACLGVIVDAKNPGALRFYAKYGFAPLGPQDEFPARMILPMATILQAYGEESQ